MPIKILMIDDHPSQIEGYKVILEFNHQGLDIETTDCDNCESAYNVITTRPIPLPSTWFSLTEASRLTVKKT